MAGATRLRPIVGLGVIGFHLALYLLLRGSVGGPERQASRPTQAPTTLRLLPWRQPTPQQAPDASTPAAQATQARAPRVPRAPAPITTAAPAATGTPAPSPAPTQADAAALPALPASQPPRPLDLSLPRGWATRPDARHPAIDDPRANTPRLTPEQRMGRTFDTQVIEEQMEDGRRRIRRGADCIIVAPSRTAQLMPFNDAAARTPSLVSACP
jgi:hypothetical protein